MSSHFRCQEGKDFLIHVCVQCLYSPLASNDCISHEKIALEAYIHERTQHHKNLNISDAGLFVSLERPYIGASPDAIVSCNCCGKGTVEVKCPFCYKEGLPDDNPSNFCMTKDSSGEQFSLLQVSLPNCQPPCRTLEIIKGAFLLLSSTSSVECL